MDGESGAWAYTMAPASNAAPRISPTIKVSLLRVIYRVLRKDFRLFTRSRAAGSKILGAPTSCRRFASILPALYSRKSAGRMPAYRTQDACAPSISLPIDLALIVDFQRQLVRSEERRVGKEGRSRWSPDH